MTDGTRALTDYKNFFIYVFNRIVLLILLFGLTAAIPSWAQIKVNKYKTIGSTALINGKIYRSENNYAQALLIRGSSIGAIGTNEEILSYTNTPIEIIDLKGATVIPGLIDSHIHAIRAGLTYGVEVSWTGVKSLQSALSLIQKKASETPKNQWIIVAGGWTENQFTERRRPTRSELDKVSLGHPVYIQHFYDSILLSTQAIQRWVDKNRSSDTHAHELLSRLTEEPLSNTTNTNSNPDWLYGSSRAISDVYNLLPEPTEAQKLKGTKDFFTELNSLGLTGVMDPGGYNLPLNSYNAVKKLSSENLLNLKIRFTICAPRRGSELTDFQQITSKLTTSETDIETENLKFNGLGENVTWGMYNNDAPTQAEKQHLKAVLLWAAKTGQTVTFHWNNNASVHHLLDVLEAVNNEQSIHQLRWSIAHLSDASRESLMRMKAMEIGWLVQNNLYYQGESFIKKKDLDRTIPIPRISTAVNLGVHVSGGTDAHRVMSYNPFVALQWFLDGKTVEGTSLGAETERPNRELALSLYTNHSAWFSFEEDKRGKLEPGYSADIAVLNKDYFTVPTEEISTIKALFTFVNGQLVYKRENRKP